MDKIDLTEYSHFALSRDRDLAGDSGPMLLSFDRSSPDSERTPRVIEEGKAVQCGSYHARSMQWQDWWLTTHIASIDEHNEEDKFIKFTTENGSKYTLRYS